MASDEAYMDFLNKANEDVSGGGAQSAQQSGSSKFKAVDTGAEVPSAIQRAVKDAFYVSDADEPFEGVSLKWNGEGGLPDEGQFSILIRFSSPSRTARDTYGAHDRLTIPQTNLRSSLITHSLTRQRLASWIPQIGTPKASTIICWTL